MTRRFRPVWPVAFVWLGSCGGTPQAAPPAQAPEAKVTCPDAAQTSAAEERYTKGRALVEGCGEECMKSEGGGGDRYKGLDLLREAGADGHLKAQSLFGRTSFGDLMTTGDGPELEKQYTEALHYLRLAARRGDADARDYLPGLASVRVSEKGDFEPPLEGPLAGLTPGWVASAFRQADAELACYSQ
jgi:TPR repeat protein